MQKDRDVSDCSESPSERRGVAVGRLPPPLRTIHNANLEAFPKRSAEGK